MCNFLAMTQPTRLEFNMSAADKWSTNQRKVNSQMERSPTQENQPNSAESSDSEDAVYRIQDGGAQYLAVWAVKPWNEVFPNGQRHLPVDLSG